MKHFLASMTTALLTCVFLLASSVAAQADGELLERWIGDWVSVTEISPSASFPNGMQVDGSGSVNWILDGQFIETHSVSDLAENKTMRRYDPVSGSFQMWTFNSNGETSFWLGEWNEKWQTLRWEMQFLPVSGVIEETFTAEDRMESVVIITDEAGTVLFEAHSVMERLEG